MARRGSRACHYLVQLLQRILSLTAPSGDTCGYGYGLSTAGSGGDSGGNVLNKAGSPPAMTGGDDEGERGVTDGRDSNGMIATGATVTAPTELAIMWKSIAVRRRR